MNWDRMEGQWKQQRRKNVHHLGTMMDDELIWTPSKYEELKGRLQGKYGIAKKEVMRQVDKFKTMVEQLKNPITS